MSRASVFPMGGRIHSPSPPPVGPLYVLSLNPPIIVYQRYLIVISFLILSIHKHGIMVIITVLLKRNIEYETITMNTL